MTTDLSTFDLLPELTRRLPAGCVMVAESGINADNIGEILRRQKFNAALIGTSLLKSSRGESADLLDKIQKDAKHALHLVHQGIATQ
jgi:indole-3-glycerol phosphate synthase